MPGHDATMVYRDGETVWLEQPTSTQALTVGQLFHINGAPYRLVEAPLVPPTVPTSGCFPYTLKGA